MKTLLAHNVLFFHMHIIYRQVGASVIVVDCGYGATSVTPCIIAVPRIQVIYPVSTEGGSSVTPSPNALPLPPTIETGIKESTQLFGQVSSATTPSLASFPNVDNSALLTSSSGVSISREVDERFRMFLQQRSTVPEPWRVLSSGKAASFNDWAAMFPDFDRQLMDRWYVALKAYDGETVCIQTMMIG